MSPRLYCPECDGYLLVSSGDHIDCHCGWKQPQEAVDCERCAELQQELQTVTDANGVLFNDLKAAQDANKGWLRLRAENARLTAKVEELTKALAAHPQGEGEK